MQETEHLNKQHILQQIIQTLQTSLASMLAQQKDSHESATHSESKAENKYDTRGLEAAYLAHGQAKRIAEIQANLLHYESIIERPLFNSEVVGLSSLVQLVDQYGVSYWLWLGQEAGGLSVDYQQQKIVVITPASPLGAKLVGRKLGDVFELTLAGKVMEYEVVILR